MRDNEWLSSQLNNLCESYFVEINPVRDISILFGRKAKQRLGSIKRSVIRSGLRMGKIIVRPIKYDRTSIITITGYFEDLQIPEEVVLSTISHELVHYVHGFSSPRPQQFEHPHKGKVVQRELMKRGLGDLHYNAERWLRKNWQKYISGEFNKCLN